MVAALSDLVAGLEVGGVVHRALAVDEPIVRLADSSALVCAGTTAAPHAKLAEDLEAAVRKARGIVVAQAAALIQQGSAAPRRRPKALLVGFRWSGLVPRLIARGRNGISILAAPCDQQRVGRVIGHLIPSPLASNQLIQRSALAGAGICARAPAAPNAWLAPDLKVPQVVVLVAVVIAPDAISRSLQGSAAV